jgi:hypothetical protein
VFLGDHLTRRSWFGVITIGGGAMLIALPRALLCVSLASPTDYEVYDERPHDSNLLIPAIEMHQTMLGRTPRLLAADAAFYSASNEAGATAKGVKRVCIPQSRDQE